jgi:transposase-like protein
MPDYFEIVEPAPVCPACHSKHRQTRAGRTSTGTQRYQCQDCKRHYCVENRRFRYPLAMRRQAAGLYRSGFSLRQIARKFSVNHQTVVNWIRTEAECEGPKTDVDNSHAVAHTLK